MLHGLDSQQLEQFKIDARKSVEVTHLQRNKKPQEVPSGTKGDRLSLGQTPDTRATYDPQEMTDLIQAAYQHLRQRVVQTLEEQGVAVRISTDTGDIDISSLTPEEAQALIAEDGYFGVEATSNRIVDFATGLAGGDPSRIDAIRKGVEDGFAEAERIWGGALPEISYKTRDVIFAKLDEWESRFG